MSDGRWQDIRRAAESATRHFRGALDLFDNENFEGAGRESYRAGMAFMHAIQSGHTSLEASLLRILDLLNEHRPTGESWHQDLITRVCSAIEGEQARPAILSEELCRAIDETRRFRNVAARGYDSFDAERALPAVEATRLLADRFVTEIEAFKDAIDGD